jgi:hypothetical protein
LRLRDAACAISHLRAFDGLDRLAIDRIGTFAPTCGEQCSGRVLVAR